MNRFIIIALVLGMLFSCSEEKANDLFSNEIYVVNGSLEVETDNYIPPKEQMDNIKSIGFDGVAYSVLVRNDEIKQVSKSGMKIYALSVDVDIDNPESVKLKFENILSGLNSDIPTLWLQIHSNKKIKGKALSLDMVSVIQEVSKVAKIYNIQLAIYPCAGSLAENVIDAFNIAQKVGRENVGIVFSISQFLKTNSDDTLADVIDTVFPKLFSVLVSGADAGDTQNMVWDQLIQPLGKGNFNTYRFVEYLLDNGYRGPIGLQCNYTDDQSQIWLGQSMETWKTYYSKYIVEENILSAEEQSEGWQLLFDGSTTANWRGINKGSFPSDGWKIKNGNLIADVHGGGESSEVGDIITEKKYSNFILKWEWSMKTKGGNSGVKYFVQEGIGDNKGYGFGLEYQLLDDKNFPWMFNGKMKPNDYRTLGGLYELYPASPGKCPSPLGLWNESMLVSDGSHVEHWLNGVKILEYERGSKDFKEKVAASKFKDTPGYGLSEEGHLLLQDHGSIVHFRNIKIKEL